MKPSTIEGLIEGLQDGAAPKHRVLIAGRDSDFKETLFEPYSIRWETGVVIIEADHYISESETT